MFLNSTMFSSKSCVFSSSGLARNTFQNVICSNCEPIFNKLSIYTTSTLFWCIVKFIIKRSVDCWILLYWFQSMIQHLDKTHVLVEKPSSLDSHQNDPRNFHPPAHEKGFPWNGVAFGHRRWNKNCGENRFHSLQQHPGSLDNWVNVKCHLSCSWIPSWNNYHLRPWISGLTGK